MGNWIQTWLNVLTRPGEPVFAEERQRPEATLSTALTWVAIAAVISGIFALLRGLLFSATVQQMGGLQGIMAQSGLPQEQIDALANFMPMLGAQAGVGALVSTILASIIGFVLFVGLLHLTARLLGGTGEFGRYAYLIAAINAPVTIVNAVLSLVPIVGGCLSLIVLIYQIVLAYFATRVEHALPQGKAIITVLMPVFIIVVVFGCIAFALAGVIATMINTSN